MPNKDEITEVLQDNITDALPSDPFKDEIRYAVNDAAEALIEKWPEILLPKRIETIEELDALPERSLLQAFLQPTGRTVAYLESYYAGRWVELDPTDRYDGENSYTSEEVFHLWKNHTVLYIPKDPQ